MSVLARAMQEAALYGETEQWGRLNRIRQENADILDAFERFLLDTEPRENVDPDFLWIEREERIFANFEDPSRKLRSFSPRTFAVERRADGGYDFEEV